MLVGDIETGTLGTMDLAIDVVILIEQPGEMGIGHFEFMNPRSVFRQFFRKFVRHVRHDRLLLKFDVVTRSGPIPNCL